MNEVLEGGELLERRMADGEPWARSAAGSLALHAALFGGIFFYAVLGGFLHHNQWGNAGAGGAIEVKLVSSAIPLPSDQPPNENVLATETPSQAPAAPSPKEQKAVDETAIPLSGKLVKPQPQTTQKTQKNQPQAQTNKAQFGEQAGSSIPRATQAAYSNGAVSLNDGDFGSRFGWYVDGINRKMATSWLKNVVDQRTPKGARVFLVFTVHRDGSVSNVQIDRSSGSPTLDRSCQQGVQRVDTFGQLPPAYNQNTLNVSYYCEY